MRSYWYQADGNWKFACDDSDQFPDGQGRIADFAVWKKPLTPQQIDALRQGNRPNQVSLDNLRQWHPLDALMGE